ncbi:MAG: TetR/AcrR family transcriptional regulator [Acidobacteria bacterium]|nr:TetR/AcrR family transcriptional regulator [Acidobacteriota bacterium]
MPRSHVAARPRKKLRGSPRERLLQAATEVFTSRGYAATSVREIVERAEVTKPVLYYHFTNKEGIYLALVGQLLAEFEDRLAEGREHEGSALERVTAMCTDLFDLVLERIDVVRFFYAVFYGPPQSAPFFEFQVFPRHFRAAISGALRGGFASGELKRRPIVHVTTSVEAMLNIATEIALTEPERQFSSGDLARLISLLFEGIATKPRTIAPRSTTNRVRTRGAVNAPAPLLHLPNS